MENEPACLLKMVQQVKHGDKGEGANGIREPSKEFIGVGDDFAMTFDMKNVVDISVEGAPGLSQEKQLNGNLPPFEFPTIADFDMHQVLPVNSLPTLIFRVIWQCVKENSNGGHHLRIRILTCPWNHRTEELGTSLLQMSRSLV